MRLYIFFLIVAVIIVVNSALLCIGLHIANPVPVSWNLNMFRCCRVDDGLMGPSVALQMTSTVVRWSFLVYSSGRCVPFASAHFAHVMDWVVSIYWGLGLVRCVCGRGTRSCPSARGSASGVRGENPPVLCVKVSGGKVSRRASRPSCFWCRGIARGRTRSELVVRYRTVSVGRNVAVRVRIP